MTLDEAIKHAEEVAEKNEKKAKNYPKPNTNVRGSGKQYNTCIKCASEHRQLAEWLKELKRLREQTDAPGANAGDLISRQAALNLFNKSDEYHWRMSWIRRKIEKLPSVTQKAESEE